MDGRMDGWRRPNHMHSLLDALQTMASVDFRRFPNKFHSVAKQASLSVAFWRDLGGCSSDFGRVWETKMDARIDFLEVFFRCFFRLRFEIDFGSFFGSSKPEKS